MMPKKLKTFYLIKLLAFSKSYKKMLSYHDENTLRGFVNFACDSVLNDESNANEYMVIQECCYYNDDKYLKVYNDFFKNLYGLLCAVPKEKVLEIKELGVNHEN